MNDKAAPDLQWFDVREWGIEGKGWTDTRNYYERLPRRAEKLLPNLWPMSRHCTGFSCEFETDASCIHARWSLQLKELNEPNMSRAAFSGLDLYALDKGSWKWAGVALNHKKRRATDRLVNDLGPLKHRFRLYFPLRNPITRLEVGLPREAKLVPVLPRTTKPIVYYGSSIVHGAYASRAGMVHPSVLGRRLDQPIVNLGFSGQAKMDEAMAHLLTELDAAVFVIDPLPNMDEKLVKERAENFVRILCRARPETPVVLVEDFPITHSWIRPSHLHDQRTKWKAFSQIYRKLHSSAYASLHYVKGLHSIGDDSAGTVDGIHPNDLGYDRLAENLVPSLLKIMSRQSLAARKNRS